MRVKRRTSQPGSRSQRSMAAKALEEAVRTGQARQDRDPFVVIQAESGRRMRTVVAEHYAETE
jgi:hypothetical protein